MNESISHFTSVICHPSAFARHLFACVLVLSLPFHQEANANTDACIGSLPEGPIRTVLRRRDIGPHHDLHDHNRRASHSVRWNWDDNRTDNDSTAEGWTIVSLFVGIVARPTVLIVAALFTMTTLAVGSDAPSDHRPKMVVSIADAEPDAVFTRSDSTDFLRSVPVRLVSEGVRKTDWGNGHIVITDPAEFPRIRAFDHFEPGSLWDNMRPNLFGQEVADEWDFYNLINTDRPDFTDATYSVGKGVTIVESGYTYTRNNDPVLHSSRRTLPEVLTRVGITDEFELRMKWFGYAMTDVTDQASGLKDSYFGGSDLQIAFKYEVRQQDDWLPMVTFLGGSTLPTGTGGVSAGAMQPFGNVVLGWGFRRWLYLKASSGVDFLRTTDVTQVINGVNPVGPVGIHGVDNNATWHQSVSLLYQATKRVGGFFEWYSFVSDNSADNRAQHYADTGLYIYLTPNTQLDVRIGERISDRVNGMFTGAGFSVRF